MVKGKTLTAVTHYGTYNVRLKMTEYQSNGTFALCVYYEDCGSFLPYCTATVNLVDYERTLKYATEDYFTNYGRELPAQFIDINNNEWLWDFLIGNEFAIFTGIWGYSGYCSYPLFLFDTQKLEVVCDGKDNCD